MYNVDLWPAFKFLLAVVNGEINTDNCHDLETRIKAAQLYLSYGVTMYKADFTL